MTDGIATIDNIPKAAYDANFKNYRSYKLVGAAQIKSFLDHNITSVMLNDGEVYELPRGMIVRYVPKAGDYIVCYKNQDGSNYYSVSPKAEFEAGYIELAPPLTGTIHPVVLAAARAAHEVNRAWCIQINDHSQPAWEFAPEWQRTSAINGVEGVLRGNGPEQSHASWCNEKFATGWKYGPKKDPEKKEHPYCVPYDELPPEQKAKDDLYVATVKAMLKAGGLMIALQEKPGHSADFERRLSAATSKPSDIAERMSRGLPVDGYRPQSTATIDLVNANKQMEERVLRILDYLLEAPDVDKRWLAIGRTAIENGFMAVNRSIFKPDRVKLALDTPAEDKTHLAGR